MERNGRACLEGRRPPNGKLSKSRVGYEVRQIRSYHADTDCKVFQCSMLVGHQHRLLSADVISAILVLRRKRRAGLIYRVRHASHRWHCPLPIGVRNTVAVSHHAL